MATPIKRCKLAARGLVIWHFAIPSAFGFRHSSFVSFPPFPLSAFVLVSGFGFRISARRRLAIASDWATINLVSLKAALMRGYARLSAVKRANARFELFRLSAAGVAPNCTKLQYFESTRHESRSPIFL